uniref:Integrase catalytic domain-containing protein n=1 Tax=Trichogramma kaykai TaxID=54128 RepID=A0ABD2W6E1_9HYME
MATCSESLPHEQVSNCSINIHHDAKFLNIHLDLVSPLPEVDGYSHLLTVIDRFSFWPEAIPLRDISAASVAFALFRYWVSSFGTPSTITSGQSQQFESPFFTEFTETLGAQLLVTTEDGPIERWHRYIIAALMCRGESENWLQALPMILLGLRTRIFPGSDVSPSEVVFGRTLKISGIFYKYNDREMDIGIFWNTFLNHHLLTQKSRTSICNDENLLYRQLTYRACVFDYDRECDLDAVERTRVG